MPRIYNLRPAGRLCDFAVVEADSSAAALAVHRASADLTGEQASSADWEVREVPRAPERYTVELFPCERWTPRGLAVAHGWRVRDNHRLHPYGAGPWGRFAVVTDGDQRYPTPERARAAARRALARVRAQKKRKPVPLGPDLRDAMALVPVAVLDQAEDAGIDPALVCGAFSKVLHRTVGVL